MTDQTAAERLEACPFGIGPKHKVRLDTRKGRHGIASPSAWFRERVVCKCGAAGTEFKRPGLAIAAWNSRTLLSERTADKETIERLREALSEIESLQPREKPFPEDWDAQIAGCEECSRYTGHPIQRGICNAHRRPLWDQEKHRAFEEKAIGYRAKLIARAALTPGASQP